MKYHASVYDAVKGFYLEQFGQIISESIIDTFPKRHVLETFMTYNHIFNYIDDVTNIMEVEE